MQTTVVVAPHSSSTRQLAYATLATLLLAGILFQMITHATGYWELAAFSFGPDLALVYGVGANLEKAGSTRAQSGPITSSTATGCRSD
jgi:hypothetical protein